MNDKLPTGWKVEPIENGRVRLTCHTMLRTNSAGCLIIPALVIGMYSGLFAYSLDGSIIASVREKQWLPWTIAAVCVAFVVWILFYSLTLREDFIVGQNYFAVRRVWFGKINSQIFVTGSQLRIETRLHRNSKGGKWWGRRLYVESGSRRAEIALVTHSSQATYGIAGVIADCANDATVQIGTLLAARTGWELLDNSEAVIRDAYNADQW